MNPLRKRYRVDITTHWFSTEIGGMVIPAGSQTSQGLKFWRRKAAEWHGKMVCGGLAYARLYATYEIVEL